MLQVTTYFMIFVGINYSSHISSVRLVQLFYKSDSFEFDFFVDYLFVKFFSYRHSLKPFI